MPACRQRSRSPLHGVRGHGDDRHVPRPRVALARADRGGGLEAVHLGHLHVHQHDVERLALAAASSAARPFAATTTRVAGLLEHAHGELLIDHVVLGEQDAQRARRDAGRGAAAARRSIGARTPAAGRPRQRAVKWNVLPAADVALDPDAAAHQLDQAAADRQAQPGAAVLARGGAGRPARRPRRCALCFSGRNADAGVADG